MKPLEMISSSIPVHMTDWTQIRCEHRISETGREYAELHIGDVCDGERVRVILYPTLGRLHRLHAVIGAYLACHGRQHATWHEVEGIPAEAATGGGAVEVDELLEAMAGDHTV